MPRRDGVDDGGVSGSDRSRASELPTAARRFSGRQWSGVAALVVGSVVLIGGLAQINAAQREAELHAFGDSITMSPCTLKSFADKFGYEQTKGTLPTQDCDESGQDRASDYGAKAGQRAAMAGGATAAAGLILTAWPRRPRRA